MKNSFNLLLSLSLFPFLGCAQNNSMESLNKNKNQKELMVGGPCEGCEAIYECPVSLVDLNNSRYLPDWNEKGPKLEVRGIVYHSDGTTPAAGIIIYVYHTDQSGIYPKKGDETGWRKRHGYLRGWMKTNEKGEYKFYTLKPASYPNSQIPAHIHVTVKEKGKTPYWLDDFLFDDDPFLTEKERKNKNPRGGSGILTTKKVENVLLAERNIILGLNIPGYPNP